MVKEIGSDIFFSNKATSAQLATTSSDFKSVTDDRALRHNDSDSDCDIDHGMYHVKV